MMSHRDGDPICPNCQGSVHVRNPTGSCDHLYWPDMLTEGAKQKIGAAELARIHGECVREFLGAIKAKGEARHV